MWKQILSKCTAVILTNWSQFVMFILGALLGMFFLAGFVSCSVVRPVWDGAKNVTGAVVGGVESGVEATYDVVTSPFDGLMGDDDEAVEEPVE